MKTIKIENKDSLILIIDSIFEYYFKCSFRDIELMEDGLYYAYDTSFHGSPHYQYKLISQDKNLIEIYNYLMKLRELASKCDK